MISPEQLPSRIIIMLFLWKKSDWQLIKRKIQKLFLLSCISSCRFRINAVKANKVFEKALANLKPINTYIERRVELICLINSDLYKIKNETNSEKTDLSRLVLPTRFELISMVPETIILSIELREQGCKYRI